MADNAYLAYDAQAKRLTCKNGWTIVHVKTLSAAIASFKPPAEETITLDGKQIEHLDTAGAWCLDHLKKQLQERNIEVQMHGFSKKHLHLLKLVDEEEPSVLPEPPAQLNTFAQIGKNSMTIWRESLLFLSFVGMLSFEVMRLISQTSRWRINAVTTVIYRTGFQALPIIALLSLMIGVVITYQMGLQLRNYGANIYIVDLLGLAILREFGPLLTAIMVAGRSGSAFTAQLGTMKVNQELDALSTMGVTPAELLLLPRILGLVIALPLLTIWADIFGVLGGMLMSKNMLNITYADFLLRFPHVIKLKNLLIGLGKAPVFALIIATIGCFEGMRVGTSADSVGRNTTRSVVLAIFFIIVADAAFSVIFSKLKL